MLRRFCLLILSAKLALAQPQLHTQARLVHQGPADLMQLSITNAATRAYDFEVAVGTALRPADGGPGLALLCAPFRIHVKPGQRQTCQVPVLVLQEGAGNWLPSPLAGPKEAVGLVYQAWQLTRRRPAPGDPLNFQARLVKCAWNAQADPVLSPWLDEISPAGPLAGVSTYGTRSEANCSGDLFEGGSWGNARNGEEWVERRFPQPVALTEISIASAGTDVSTEGASISLLVQTPDQQWFLVDRIENANIVWTQLSGGLQGVAVPAYHKILNPAPRVIAFRLVLQGHGWFAAGNIQLKGKL
ncbi:MAG: hypothetical protein U0931_29465 [Vulcanimicrobiota bacterium]